MTAVEFIQQRFQAFGIQLSEADTLDVTLSSGIDGEEHINTDNHTPITVAMVKYIPTLLLRASSINENGFSMSWDINSIKSYYSLMCQRYGLTDELNTTPKVKFL